MAEVTLKPGDRFSFDEDGTSGIVREVHLDETGAQASAVVELDSGKWYAIDLSKVSMSRETLH